MFSRSCVLVLAAAMSLGLAACHRDTGAQSSADANNKPPAGSTGSGGGTSAMGGPGTGLNGGLGQGRPGQQTGVAEGTGNRTPKNNVGSR